jgi:hypothetical protein
MFLCEEEQIMERSSLTVGNSFLILNSKIETKLKLDKYVLVLLYMLVLFITSKKSKGHVLGP